MTHSKTRKIQFILAYLTGVASCYLVMNCCVIPSKFNTTATSSITPNTTEVSASCQFQISRHSQKGLTLPILFAEPTCETAKYQSLKQKLADFIEEKKKKGAVEEVGFYLRDFINGDWAAINGNESFNPGSLLKVPVMLTVLKMAERDPDFLNFEIDYQPKNAQILPQQLFISESIQPGKTYTIRQLLEFMIVHSDNFASGVLLSQIDHAIFKELFEDVQLPLNKTNNNNYPISAMEYSNFFKILVNSTFLTKEKSEYALSLLAKSTFSHGFRKGLPKNVTQAIKFGEYTNQVTGVAELHESGVIYVNGIPRVLTIFTRGKDFQQLANCLADFSKLVYDDLNTTTTK